ncbi:MAG: Uma2 family endonuclease [Anaerolineae bacterium]|nr:Uma2 family endonuclease [Candidatus Roseilinea sp.]MDW8451215.1 Uma2 family endonuclease [Anaerolineae bacterium]
MSVEIQPAVRTTAQPDAVPTMPIWRLSVGQYHDMIAAGILTDDDPVELLEGWLVPKMPKNPARRLSTQLTREALERALPAGWYVDAQEPITTSDSEPEPDVVVVRGERRRYHDRHPGPEDVALVVEIADTTLQRDRTIKKRLYARAGIPRYWIVNLVDRQIEAYAQPRGGDEADYLDQQIYHISDEMPVTLGDGEVMRIAVRDLLP